MTTDNPNNAPKTADDIPSPDEMNELLASLMGGMGNMSGDDAENSILGGLGAINPADLFGDLGDENMLNDLMKGGGGGMGQLTRMFGGGGLERMMSGMMEQLQGAMSQQGADAGVMSQLTAETLANIPDMQLINQVASHAHHNMAAAYDDAVDRENPTPADDVKAMLTLPKGQRALLATTRAIGSIKMEGLETFVTIALEIDERVIDTAVSGFQLFDMPELAKLLGEAKAVAVKLVQARTDEADFDVTDPLEDALTDLEDAFGEVDFMGMHDQEITFIRANPDLFIDS